MSNKNYVVIELTINYEGQGGAYAGNFIGGKYDGQTATAAKIYEVAMAGVPITGVVLQSGEAAGAAQFIPLRYVRLYNNAYVVNFLDIQLVKTTQAAPKDVMLSVSSYGIDNGEADATTYSISGINLYRS